MTTLAKFLDHNTFEPFDILFKDFFSRDSFFTPIESCKSSYPTDIYEDGDNLIIDIAVAGLDKEDIKIEEEHGILKVSYDKKEEVSNDNKEKRYVQRSIARRSFNLGWRISDKFDLGKIKAEMDKGVLKISIPKSEEKKTIKKIIKIN